MKIKIFKNLGLALLGFAMAAGVGVRITGYKGNNEVNAIYEGDSPWSHTFASGEITTVAGSIVKNGVTLTFSKATYIGFDNAKGVQIGSSKNAQTNEWTISCPISDFGNSASVSKVAIKIACGSSGSLSYKIGIGDSGTSTSFTSTSLTEVSRELTSPVNSGSVTISLKAGAKAMYLYSIEIVFSTEEEEDSISITDGDKTISLENGTVDTSIKYTTTGTGSLGSKKVDGDDVATIALSDGTVSITAITTGQATYKLTKGSAESTNTISITVTEKKKVNNVKFVDKDEQTITTFLTYISFSTKDTPKVVVEGDAGVSQSVTYTSSNTSVVSSVTSSTMTISGTGTSTITATSVADTTKYAELTVTVENDEIDQIRIQSGSTIPTQCAGSKLDLTGVTFEKHWKNGSKWNVFASDDSVIIPDTCLTLETTSITVKYNKNQEITYNVSGFTVVEAPKTFNIRIKSDSTSYKSYDDATLFSNNLSITEKESKLDNPKSLITFTTVSGICLGGNPYTSAIMAKKDGTSSFTFSINNNYYATEITYNIKNDYQKSGKYDASGSITVNQQEFDFDCPLSETTTIAYAYSDTVSFSFKNRVWINYIDVKIEKADAAAETYAKNFNNANVCGTDNNTPAITSVWTKQASIYNNAASPVQTAISGGTASESGATQLEQCLARYDRAVSQALARGTSESINDFMGRKPSSDVRVTTLNVLSSNSSTWIIVIVSLTGLTAIGGYFFYKKRKENI